MTVRDALREATNIEEVALQPNDFELHQNFPNPFNHSTTIKFSVLTKCNVKLSLYNILGKNVNTLIRREYLPGHYEINLDADHLSSGIYFYKIQMSDFQNIKKLLLVK